MSWQKTILLVLLVLTILLGGSVLAQPPAFREQLVYSLASFNGATFSKSFCPQSENTLYFIANQENVINPRKTIVYYWPITRKYMAGFSTLNEDVPGKIEVLKDGKVIQTLEKRKYSFYYPEGYWSEKTIICLDEEADKYYQKYKKAVEEFNQKLKEYYQKMTEYRKKLNEFFEEVRRRREQGESGPLDIPIPKEPKPPEFVKFYATEPQEGFIIKLPAGHYQIRLVLDDGTIFEGSEKKVVVFESRRKGGVGYEIIPGNRWTKEENCDDPSWIIHAVGKNNLYFKPFYQEEYNELYHNKLQDPQNIGRIERFKWVHTEEVDNAYLLFGKGEEIMQKVEKAPYFVKQIPGPELGYEILPYDEELKKRGYQPTFQGYKVTLSENLAKTDYTIQMVDAEKGELLPKSERTIRLLKKENHVYLYPIAVFPLVIGAVVALSRMRKVER